mgnify:CR=1 FL=1
MRQRFGFVFRIDQQIKNIRRNKRGRALRLLLPRIQVSKRLGRLRMRGCFFQNAKIGVDSVFGPVLFQKTFGAFQCLLTSAIPAVCLAELEVRIIRGVVRASA